MSVPEYAQYGGRPPQAGVAQPGVASQVGIPTGEPAYPGMHRVPPQPAVSPKKQGGKIASRVSLICGVLGLVIVGATAFAMWYMINDLTPNSDPSGADIIGFFPLFALVVMGPVNMVGFVTGVLGVAFTPKAKTVVGWLGIILNAAPYVALFASMWFIP